MQSTEAADPTVLLDIASEELARLVRRQWDREATLRGLLRPEPLRVRWSSTGGWSLWTTPHHLVLPHPVIAAS